MFYFLLKVCILHVVFVVFFQGTKQNSTHLTRVQSERDLYF